MFIDINRHDRSKVLEDYLDRSHCEELNLKHSHERRLNRNAPAQSLPIWNPKFREHDANDDLQFCLGDFGSSVNVYSTEYANPAGQWRAPETLLGAGWQRGPTDIWDLGSVVSKHRHLAVQPKGRTATNIALR